MAMMMGPTGGRARLADPAELDRITRPQDRQRPTIAYRRLSGSKADDRFGDLT